MLRSLAVALALAVPSLASEKNYEWAGIFDVSEFTTVQWIAQKVDGDYADPAMKIIIQPVTGPWTSGHEHLDAVEAATNTALGAAGCTNTAEGTTIVPASTAACLNLQFNANSYVSLWPIDVTAITHITIFAEHIPTEFEDTTHYLRATDGTDIEPIDKLPEKKEAHKEWGMVLISCGIVNLMTFFGVVLLACKLGAKISPTQHGGLSGFAAGALLACAVYLILVEAMHLIMTNKSYEEVDVVWRWGTSFLGGYLIALVLFLIEPGMLKTKDKEGVEDRTLSATLFAVCVGDFAHNLVDGFAIGFAWKMCTSKLAWTITAATVYHEIAQEIGDFALLTQDVGLSIPVALAWNFVAGTSVIIGGIIVTAVEISDELTGILLAFGGGTYVYLAASEALPRALRYAEQLESKDNAAHKKHHCIVLLSFIIGAVLIGVVLVEHEHCVPGGGAHAH